jgi:alanine-glyoxylate transaminase/serine-glyoxylate transaminase/serine-pyruvate transaminase
MIRSGRHFLQIPGPTNVPDRVLNAMHRAVMDQRASDYVSRFWHGGLGSVDRE